jgi:hypothetical protein
MMKEANDMSDTGLFTILYDEIREHAELIDGVLLGLKTGQSTPSDSERLRLAQTLDDMAREQGGDLSTRMLELSLRESGMASPQQWRRVAEQLRAPQVDSNVLEMLESAANSLEMQRSGTVARMRGRTR